MTAQEGGPAGQDTDVLALARSGALAGQWSLVPAESSAEFANRPGFLRLMNALKPRAPFQVLIISKESRLRREAMETACAIEATANGRGSCSAR